MDAKRAGDGMRERDSTGERADRRRRTARTLCVVLLATTPLLAQREVAERLATIEADRARLQAAVEAAAAGPDPTPAEVAAELRARVELDQLLRNELMAGVRLGGDEGERLMAGVAPLLAEHDRANTRRLHELIDRHGWPAIGVYGEQADRDAWLLVQHADHDRPFQQRVLALLEPLAARGETDPVHFAYLSDRFASGTGQAQRYGTQGRCTKSGWEPFELVDPERVDELRAEVGLGPLDEYRERMVAVCTGTG